MCLEHEELDDGAGEGAGEYILAADETRFDVSGRLAEVEHAPQAPGT